MSRDAYVGAGGNRSPRSVRRVGELPTVDRSPSRSYPTSGGRGSPIGRKGIRSGGANSPDHAGGYGYHHQTMGSPYYSRDDELGSPMLEERGRSMTSSVGHHRSRSASRPSMVANPMTVRYQSLDRGGTMIGDPMAHEREFMPIREPRDRSLDRAGVRDRSLERGLYLEDELYGSRSARQSPHGLMGGVREPLLGELQHQNTDLQRELGNLKKELELTNQKLGSSMHSIKTFWSPELKKERALRKEESAKYSLINDQLKLLSSENQKQAMLVRQLEEELRMLRMRGPSMEMQQQMEVLFQENEHLTREIAILRDTIKELELRIETQKQTLQARDESIKKLLEMLQNKGMGKEEERQMFQQMQAMAQKQLDEFRVEIQRRDQEILAMSAKMKTLEEQHQDYQRHIAVLKESLCAKEEHYNMLQADVEELRMRLDEKNRLIEKKTQQAVQAQQERNRMNGELGEIKEHMDIKDRKINVLQRKLDLHEATKKLQATAVGQAKAGEDTTAIRRQMEEQRKQLDEQSRQVEEHRKTADSKFKQVNEKERVLQELEKQLQKRKDQMDNLEASLKKAGGNAAAVADLNKELDKSRQELQKAKEEAQRSSAEMERLLQLVQMSQEEQNTKEKQIVQLQQALKNAQQKQQQAAAQLEEQRKKEEILSAPDQVSSIVDTSEKICKPNILDNLNGISRTKNNNDSNGELSLDELETLMDLVHVKENRIYELEDALRESVTIVAERETALHQEETRRKQIMDKVYKLEQRLLSLQSAQALKCHSCGPLVARLRKLESSWGIFIGDRKKHLQEIAEMKQEALESAISEKDAHLALLEMSGIRNERQASDVDQLKKDKKRLMERLKIENENIIQQMNDCEKMENIDELCQDREF